MHPILRGFKILVVVAVAFAGCMPLNATNAIRDAEASLADAEAAHAAQLAPYDYWKARAYLYEAKRSEGYSEFGYAELYAQRSATAAKLAVDNARVRGAKEKAAVERERQEQAQPPPGAKAPMAPQAAPVRAPTGGQ